jgi:hypothetical protein
MTVKFRSLLLLLALIATSASVHAEPNAADLESARALFRDANALRDAGQHQAALEKYRAANALGRTPITGYELGRAYVNVGQLIEARDVLLSIDRLPVKAGESAKATESRRLAGDLARELGERIPSVTIELSGATPGATVVLLVDGAVIPPEAHGLPRRLNPGSHKAEANVGGVPAKPVTFTLVERQTQRVTIAVASPPPSGVLPTAPGALPPPTAPPATIPPPPPVETPAAREAREREEAGRVESELLASRRSKFLIGGYTAIGLGVVGLVIGAVAAANVIDDKGTLERECVGTQCPESAEGTLDDARSSATVAGVATLTGALLSGVGVVLVVKGYGIDPSTPAPQTGRSLSLSVSHAF